MILMWLLISTLFAEPNFEPQPVSIILNTSELKDPEAINPEIENIWRERCSKFIESFKVGQGPYGFGLFTGFNCRLNEKYVVGAPQMIGWILKINARENSLQFEISATLNPSKIKPVLTEYMLEKNSCKKTVAIFNQPNFNPLVALALLEQLPVAGVMAKEEFLDKKQIVFPPLDSSVFSDIKNIIFYHIKSAHDIWQTEVYSTLDIQTGELHPNIVAPRAKGATFVWLHNESGPHALNGNLQKKIQEIVDQIKESDAEESINSFQLRLGAQIFKGDPALEQAKFVGAYLRRRLSADFSAEFAVELMPPVSGSKESLSTTFSSSDFAVRGIFEVYKFDLGLTAVINPEFGYYNLNTSIVEDRIDYYGSAEFDLRGLFKTRVMTGFIFNRDRIKSQILFGGGMAAKSLSDSRFLFGDVDIDAKYIFPFVSYNIDVGIFYMQHSAQLTSTTEIRKDLKVSFGLLGIGAGVNW